jgi:Mor family transcriptional regulator
MSEDHEEWLRKQGVRVTGRSTLRHASMPAFSWMNDDSPVDWMPDATIRTEQVYTVELTETILKKLQYNEDRLQHIHEYAKRTGGMPESYFLDNSERHRNLLQENQMYKDAWKEFQTIRALLGETPHWP